MADLVTLDQIRDAGRTIRRVARVTPLVEISNPGGPSVLVKCENLQVGGSFKIRGAANMVSRLGDEARRRGVVTYSSGNHGRAVAIASRAAGIRAVIVMPETAPKLKINAVRELDAEVIFAGTTSLQRKQRAEEEAERRGLTLVPPYDHRWIVAGQGTAGVEMCEQCEELTEIYVPIGGGGLIAGVAAAVKALRPNVRVVGVEPAGAARMTASLRAGAPITLDESASIADGLLPLRPGDLTFAHVQAHVDEVVTVRDDEIASTVVWLFYHAKLVSEPSGAAALAALMTSLRGRRELSSGSAAAAVISGGNIAAEDLLALTSQSPSLFRQ